MTIPFIRVFPNGRNGLTEITRSADIEALAHRFIAHDGRYLIMIADDGAVKLAAVVLRDGEPDEVAAETCDNGPKLLEAVDRLVRKSAEHPQAGGHMERAAIPTIDQVRRVQMSRMTEEEARADPGYRSRYDKKAPIRST